MQTFLPYPNFQASVETLDMKRLGKQRVETFQILKALKQDHGGLHGGWARHPASRMWEGFELALLEYQQATVDEWVNIRGYKDTCLAKSLALFTPEELQDYLLGRYDKPDWFGDDTFHAAHRSNLVRKFPEHYRLVFGDIADDMEYVWPGRSLEEAKVVMAG